MFSSRNGSFLRVVLLGGAILCGACESTGVSAALYVPVAPPPPPREVLVVSPGEGYIWIAGYHAWSGGAYVWVPGRWEKRPHSRAHWQKGHWRHARRGWYWVEGRWR